MNTILYRAWLLLVVVMAGILFNKLDFMPLLVKQSYPLCRFSNLSETSCNAENTTDKCVDPTEVKVTATGQSTNTTGASMRANGEQRNAVGFIANNSNTGGSKGGGSGTINALELTSNGTLSSYGMTADTDGSSRNANGSRYYANGIVNHFGGMNNLTVARRSNHPCSPWSTSGLILPVSGGQLGNQMNQYASTMALAKMKGAKPVLPWRTLGFLKLFPNLTVTLKSTDLSHRCMHSLYTVNPRSPWRDRIIYKSNYIHLDNYASETDWYHMVADQLRKKDFIFKDSMIKDVNGYFGSLAKSLQSTMVNFDISKIAYIGIHVRRTSYRKALKRYYKQCQTPFWT